MSHDDDAPIGRLVSRREVLAWVALGGAGAVLGCRPGTDELAAGTAGTGSSEGASGGAVPSCIARPELTEGPYFVEEALERSDIRSDPATGERSPGTPLAIRFQVSRIDGGGRCTALPGARVDVWHCDALGVYSDVRDPNFDTTGKRFLRGHQLTDASGVVGFSTIYPGWYRGRAVHVHFMIRTEPDAPRGHAFTSQLFFDDALTDRVHAAAPYATKGRRDRRNEQDGIYREGGDRLLLAVAEAGTGYASSFDVGLRMD